VSSYMEKRPSLARVSGRLRPARSGPVRRSQCGPDHLATGSGRLHEGASRPRCQIVGITTSETELIGLSWRLSKRRLKATFPDADTQGD